MPREDWPQTLNRPVLANFRTPAYAQPPRVRRVTLRPGMDPYHLVLIRQLACSVCPETRRIEAHHLKSGPARHERGLGMKATDRWSVPLCWLHHAEIERIASIHERDWFLSFAMDPQQLATHLWCATGDPALMARILLEHKHQAIRILREARDQARDQTRDRARKA